MLTGKRKNKKPSEDEELFYSDIINNPAIFTSMYSEKLAPQFQSIFSELDESYAKNPPPNIGAQLALKPNGLSFQPILDLTPNNQANSHSSNQMTNNNNQINNQMNLQANNLHNSLHNNQLSNIKPTNQIQPSTTNNLENANKLSNLLGQQSSRNQFSILFTGAQLNQPLQPNKLSDSSLTAAASSSPYTKHFSANTLTSLGSSLSNSLTTNLLNLKNKFSQQKNTNYFKNYKSYKDMMINNPLNINQQISNQQHHLNSGASSGSMLAAANQYNYFQQRPNQPLPVFQQQPSFNRYQMIQSASTKKKCKNIQCPSSSKKSVVQHQFNSNNNFNNNNYNNKIQDYESNLINNNVIQKQFYSMQQEKQRPTFNSNTYSSKTNGGFSQQKQNNFYKPVSEESTGTQIKVGSDIITYDDIEQALRRNNLHKVTNKDAQVYAQLHNLLMNTVQANNGQFNNYQVDSKVNVEDNRSPRMFSNKGKIFDDTYQQQQTQLSTKGWRPKITQQTQQQEINQVKDTDLDQKLLFDEPQIKETDQQQKLTEEDDFSQITQQKEPIQQQVITTTTNTQWQPVSKPTTKSPAGVKTKSKSKSGTKTPNKKSPAKGTKSPAKLAKLQLSADSNSTDTNKTSDNSTTNVTDTSINTTASSVEDELNKEVEDISAKLANSTTTLITQNGPNGTMKIIKKIKRRKKKRITSDKSNDLQAVRKNAKSQTAKLIANSFEDQVKTDVSSEVESTTNSAQLIDTTTSNANTEVQFDDTTAVSDEQLDQKRKVSSTTVTLNTMPNKQEQVKGRMLAKKKKVMESISTTTQSSDSLIDSSPDTSHDDSLETSLDENKKNNDQDTYFNENVTESNDNLNEDNLRSNRLKIKNSVRKKKQKSSNLIKNRPAHTSINSPLGDFTATFSADDEEAFKRIRKNKAHTNKQMDADESLENMHFRIDDVDADDYDNLNNKDNENDGFSNGFSNEFIDNSETRNQLNKLSLNGQPAGVDVSGDSMNKQFNQTLFNSLLKNNKLMNNTSLGSVQPIPHLVMMSMNAGNDNLGEEESLDNMDVNQTIADLVQKINQANNGDLDIINEYRNYFTEEEFDLLTELLKREANKTSNHLNLNFNNSNKTHANLIKKDQVSTAESQRKDSPIFYTDYDEKETLRKFNSSPPIYLDNNGQDSLKEYYNNKEDIGKDVLINILNTKSKSPILGQPGIDYPTISTIFNKKSKFSCLNRKPGYYADYSSGCLRYYICTDNVINNTQQAFYCSDGTLFDQRQSVCRLWYNVSCQSEEDKLSDNNNTTYSDNNSNSSGSNSNSSKSFNNSINLILNESTNQPVYVPNLKRKNS